MGPCQHFPYYAIDDEDVHTLFSISSAMIEIHQRCWLQILGAFNFLIKPIKHFVPGKIRNFKTYLQVNLSLSFNKFINYAPLYTRAGHLKWIVVLILEVIVLMFETTGGLVRGHLVKNSCLTVDTKFWGKWQKCPPQKANFFVCQPNRMKFLQQLSHNI